MKKLISILIIALASSCASYDSADISAAGEPRSDGATSGATDALYAHDLDRARTAYADEDNAAGYAVTSLLLLPYSEASTRIITQHLGGRDALNAQGDVIWGEQGLAYFVSRGVSWDDSPSTAGIKTLLVDRLPWSRRQLDSVDGFVDGLNNPVSFLADDLVALADELGEISDAMSETLNRPTFESYFLPGQALHDETLDLRMGRSEFSALKAAVEAGRAVLYLFSAYDHEWTLERAFGESIWAEVAANPDDADHVEGAEVIDYQAAHLNESLGRAVRAADRLERAQLSTAAALSSVADMFRFGTDQTTATALNWRSADEEVAGQLAEFFDALASAVDSPTVLPYVTPETTADLGVIFSGRTVGDEQDLLFVDRFEDEFDTYAELTPDEAVLDTLIEGTFTPELDQTEFVIADASSDLVQSVSDDLITSFEASSSSF